MSENESGITEADFCIGVPLPVLPPRTGTAFKTAMSMRPSAFTSSMAQRRHRSDDALLLHINAIHTQTRGGYGWPAGLCQPDAVRTGLACQSATTLVAGASWLPGRKGYAARGMRDSIS